MVKLTRLFEFIIYWTIILIPFSMAIASAPMNVFMGFLLFSFLLKKIIKREKLFPNTAINVPFLFLLIVSVISIVNSISLKDSIKGGVLKLIQYCLLFLAMSDGIRDTKHIRRIILSMILGICFVSFDGIWQVIMGRDIVRGYAPIINIGLVRATASFKDSNLMGIYVSAIIPLCMGLTLYYFRGRKRIIMILVSLLVLGGLALTYSRPSLLAVYVSLLFLSIVKKDKIMISILVILTIIAPFIMPKSLKEWARQIDYNPLIFMCNYDRIAIYRNSINMIKHHPIIGVGVNTFMKNYKLYKESPEYRNIITSDYMYAHNNFLHMAGEIGLFGLGIFIWLLFRIFRETAHIYGGLKDYYLKIVSVSLIASLIAFLVNGLTESSLYYSRVSMIFWYIIGFSLALRKFCPPQDSGVGFAQ